MKTTTKTTTHKSLTIRRRRIIREIRFLQTGISDTLFAIKNNPYKQDHPKLRRQLRQLQEDQLQARGELTDVNETIEKAKP